MNIGKEKGRGGAEVSSSSPRSLAAREAAAWGPNRDPLGTLVDTIPSSIPCPSAPPAAPEFQNSPNQDPWRIKNLQIRTPIAAGFRPAGLVNIRIHK
eukprot:689086-Prorocentrum_minimum.AAC.1